MKTTITFEIDSDRLENYTDEYLAAYWHVSQANPASYGDTAACQLAEAIKTEITRRWLAGQQAMLHAHKAEHAFHAQRTSVAPQPPVPPQARKVLILTGYTQEAVLKECHRYCGASGQTYYSPVSHIRPGFFGDVLSGSHAVDTFVFRDVDANCLGEILQGDLLAVAKAGPLGRVMLRRSDGQPTKTSGATVLLCVASDLSGRLIENGNHVQIIQVGH